MNLSSHFDQAMRLVQAHRFAEALPLARQVAEHSTVCSSAHGLLATIYLRLGERGLAEATITAALECESGPAAAYDALAFVSLQLGRHDRANALYHRTVLLAPDTARFWYNLASSERGFGRLREAEDACNRAVHLDKRHYQSHQLRSELRTQTETSNHVKELLGLLGQPDADDRARMFLAYALGKELDDLGRYDEAFHWFMQGAAARRRHLTYDVAVDERKLARIAAVFPDLGTVATNPEDSARFIFIVGLPRTGTTLLERVLTGLPGVVSNGETENFSQALLGSAATTGADIFARAAAADYPQVGRRYAKVAGHPNEPKVIEKLPLNFLYLGAIRRALPGSIPIVMSRHPMDSCFAMYRTLFGAAYPYSYDLDELAAYYAAYERLMGHWRAVLGRWLVEVTYEELAGQPERAGSTIARACGLTWTSSATQIEKNSGVSMTASAAQVRRPIYQGSIGKWRHYSRHLEPLRAALKARGVVLS